jgi:hypothetical protein
MTMKPFAFCAILAALGLAACQSSRKEEDKLDLRWMTGSFVQYTDSTAYMEVWIAENDSTLKGRAVELSRDGKDTLFFEQSRIEVRGGKAAYIVQLMSDVANPIRFEMTSAADSSLVFENPLHDFPKRIAYQRKGDVLEANVDGGAEEAIKLKMTRTEKCVID